MQAYGLQSGESQEIFWGLVGVPAALTFTASSVVMRGGRERLKLCGILHEPEHC